MSVFHLPRLHFAGTAITRLPTGPRAGWLDLETNQAIDDQGVFDTDRPVQEYYDFLADAKGHNFAGNGHFWVDAKVVATELAPGEVRSDDLVTGRQLDLWGHFCDYTAGTANRSRVFDVDPASNWTTTLMVGQLALGRSGRSHDVPYLVTGDVNGMCPPRWNQFHTVLHQFAVDKAEGLHWLSGVADSPVLTRLREVVENDADGLVVQFALSDQKHTGEGQPDVWQLRGTVAAWYRDELRSYPAGRLLTPRTTRSALHNLSVHVSDDHVTANLVTAHPDTDLEVRTTCGTLLATIPSTTDSRTSGVVVAARVDGATGNPAEALVITDGEGTVLSREEETVVESDEAALFLEHENTRTGEDHAVEIPVRSYVRGVPARVDQVHVRQYVNPAALPLAGDRDSAQLVAFLPTGQAGYQAEQVLSTDEHGRGTITLKGVRGGATRVLLRPEPTPEPQGTTAAERYDNDDEQGYWSAVGSVAVRVLPNHWHLDDLPDEDITFSTVYREALAYYELQYSFMRSEVLSLADEFKVEPYARLIWHVSAPEHKGRTFYMPPTRDMSAPQIRMLLRYLLADDAQRQTPPTFVPQRRELGTITTKDQLLHALYQAAAIELATMVQYLYAAYSVPTHGAGRKLVQRGEWTEEQLLTACGEGTETWSNGIRGSLMSVAREEMMHFLAINNILMAMGRPFHLPELDFGTFNSTTCVPLEFSLEALNLASVQRFVALEQPHDLIEEIEGNDSTVLRADGEPYQYGSLSELYAAIREGVQAVPGVFLVKKGRGGGAHHLFMRESVNAAHPDYQLEVDDVASAVFAIDFVTEHGEGGQIPSTLPEEESHFDTFLRISEMLIAERAKGPNDRRIPWNPAYPVMRNPTLKPGNAAMDHVTHEPARIAMKAFNRSYFMAMQLMVQHFGYSPDKSLRRSRLMNFSLDIMTGVLRPLGELIVTLPSGRPGRTAGPSFELDSRPEYISRPDVAVEWMAREFDEVADLARKCVGFGLTPTVGDLLAFIGDSLRTMDLKDL
ncbi:ferritin-like domain-containing protein [Lentzea flaviverrucosa]|uniref:Ferritin-like n=1 Tax=Lentzea flaviverrucosa TaxID=200379 RepID=A0A1H9BQ05_9PSEU|nr:ferritin-like domain-containing protein [Lentzea flaviverrucosa]RDI31721.1 ferritin-like protein [Lentzea flaviverrucosa]SEP90488.1 Ferritin-like [Lentzea flaviverrucosa]